MLRERDGLRPGLCVALRIQLSDAAEVRCEPDEGTDELSERIAATAARVRELDARLGVILERDPDPGRVRMYIVSADSAQAVIAIERIEDRPEPDVDRSLALKVRDAYEVVEAVAEAPSPLLATLSERRPSGPEHALFLEAGGGLGVGAGARGLATLTLGLSRAQPGFRLEAGVGARFGSGSEVVRSFGRVSVRERGPLVSLRATHSSERLEVGGVVEAMASLVSALGTASDGARGERRLLTPTLGLGADLRVRLFASAFLRFAPMLELSAFRRRFSVDERVVSDEGLVRLTLPLSLLVSLPLRGSAERLEP